MSEAIEKSNMATVPSDVRQALLHDETDVQTKVGAVAKFNHNGTSSEIGETIIMQDTENLKTTDANDEFVGLTKEELKDYINNAKWKRIRWIIVILYVLLLILLLVGAILLIIYSPKCPPKPKLVWYEKEVIYDVNVMTFRDSNKDGIGDLKGVLSKIQYFEKYHIKSILLQSTIFNVTGGTSLKLDGGALRDKNVDLLRLDPAVGSDSDFQELLKSLNRIDMHLIIDLPLSSTLDPNGYLWYGSSPLPAKIKNPCSQPVESLACHYYKSYGRLPLDFNNENIGKEAESRLRYWLFTKKVDGVRVDLPLFINKSSGSYEISYSTIDAWNSIKKDIEKNTKPKLLLFDIPFAFQNITTNAALHNKTGHSLLLLEKNESTEIDAQTLDKRLESFEKGPLPKPLFWQLGSNRRSDEVGIIKESQLPREMVMTLIMLLGGTPIILYGEEIGLDQTTFPLMSWIPDKVSGGFSACEPESDCGRQIANYQSRYPETSVKRQEAAGAKKTDTLLILFGRLSRLRLEESFQFGILESSYDPSSNIFWFIREASGHKGYCVVLNLNRDKTKEAHVSLHELTKGDVPRHVHYEYQWPEAHLFTPNKTYIDSDNLVFYPQSISIVWWTAKVIKPNVLAQAAQEHSHH